MTSKPESPQSARSLQHGGWMWREQLQEWHKLLHLEQGRGKERTKHTVTLLRRDVRRNLLTSLHGPALVRLNRQYGFTYGENKS